MLYARVLIVGGAIAVSAIAYGQMSTAELLKACNEPTKVYGKVGGGVKPVGEQLDGLCRGYLEAAFDTLLAGLPKSVCLSGVHPSADYLASVLKVYLKDHPQSQKETAAVTVKAALSRAFPCRDADIDPLGLLSPEENDKRRTPSATPTPKR
jgi:hypothetical protein